MHVFMCDDIGIFIRTLKIFKKKKKHKNGLNEKQYKHIFTCIVFNEPLGIPLHLCWHHSLGIFMKEKAVIRRQIPFQYYMLSSYIFTSMI